MNGDTISRSSVLRKLDSFHPDYTFNIASFKNLIKAEPTVEKKGKWIPKEDQRFHCSKCNSIAPKGIRWMFCPNCGADMRGEYNG